MNEFDNNDYGSKFSSACADLKILMKEEFEALKLKYNPNSVKTQTISGSAGNLGVQAASSSSSSSNSDSAKSENQSDGSLGEVRSKIDEAVKLAADILERKNLGELHMSASEILNEKDFSKQTTIARAANAILTDAEKNELKNSTKTGFDIAEKIFEKIQTENRDINNMIARCTKVLEEERLHIRDNQKQAEELKNDVQSFNKGFGILHELTKWLSEKVVFEDKIEENMDKDKSNVNNDLGTQKVQDFLRKMSTAMSEVDGLDCNKHFAKKVDDNKLKQSFVTPSHPRISI